ncbi:MAG: RluA family pseudouridine synthase [Acidimicrobiia bacterium]|nr:RluA family pseudouridine synthase [Acidimicrobiia bacterium]MYC56993.1 RluA family pseudouridine synthase [Acidimicrobiia bacterium]MYG94075.1 RluA family pseudouridine synthase [Acidimicrobiia bacterium]MYI30858.1 RluA family pseudouridine synthase [Acidimicrobiia bacterium]
MNLEAQNLEISNSVTEPALRLNAVVPSALAQERLDRLVALIWECSRAEAARLVAEGKVALNGTAVTTRSRRVVTGDAVKLTELPVVAQVAPQPDASVHLDLLYEDEHVVVVNKPAQLVVYPGTGNSTGTMANGLLALYPEMAYVGEPQRPGIVHRLDKGTSGVLMAARTQVAYEALTGALSRREVKRCYSALVAGLPSDDRGVIDAPVGRSPRCPTKMAVLSSGHPARTHYVVLDRISGKGVTDNDVAVAHLDLQLETGRTHQIRVHLAAIGHPLLGDELYGGPRVVRLSRPALHARTLGCIHPTTAEPLHFEVPPPQDFVDVLALVGITTSQD